MTEEQKKTASKTAVSRKELLCTIGEKLQQERQHQGLSQDAVIKTLKFNHSSLNALETGDWSEMPEDVYALGFLRQYAALLNIELSSDIKKLSTNSYVLTAPLTFPDAPISPNRTWAIISIVLFILIIIVANLLKDNSNSDALTEESASVPYTQESMLSPSNNKVLELREPVIAVTSPAGITPPATQEEETKSAVVPTKAKINKTYTFLAASDEVWLRVYQKEAGEKRTLRREALLKKGKSFSLSAPRGSLLITSGNSIALQISSNGKILYAAGSLGKKGQVLRFYPLKVAD